MCPSGYRIVTYAEADANKLLLCARLQGINTALALWGQNRIAGGGSFDGPSRNCVLRQSDNRVLTSTLCVPGSSAQGECGCRSTRTCLFGRRLTPQGIPP